MPELLPIAGLLLAVGVVGGTVIAALAAAPKADPTEVAASRPQPETGPPQPLQLTLAYVVLSMMVASRVVTLVLTHKWQFLVSAVVVIFAIVRLSDRRVEELRIASFICFGTFALNILLLFAFVGTQSAVIWPAVAVEAVYLLLVFGGFLLLESPPVKKYFGE